VTEAETKLYRLLGGEPVAGFEIDPFAKECLTNGIDELGYFIRRAPEQWHVLQANWPTPP